MGVGFKNLYWGQAFGSLLNNGPAIPVSCNPISIIPSIPVSITPDTSNNSHTTRYTTTTTTRYWINIKNVDTNL
ncbi:hypothetical protein Glove_174g37 [Diversispora epigaea]|uniref:Uncharacterized protein n=1 Tax=Diversispora epigaea TaxID=1348612 RepID=A0A397ITK0_9GLOM|nr:hypothetical protein Glove_174g37 [Diversispora epigaea]